MKSFIKKSLFIKIHSIRAFFSHVENLIVEAMEGSDSDDMAGAVARHLRAIEWRAYSRPAARASFHAAAAAACVCCDGVAIAMDVAGLSAGQAAACFPCESTALPRYGRVAGASQRVAVGEVEVLCMKDGDGIFDPRDFFRTVDAATMSAAADVPAQQLRLSFGTALVRCPSGVNVIIDAGLGVCAPPHQLRSRFDLRATLWRDAALRPSDVDLVVHTHLHRQQTGAILFF